TTSAIVAQLRLPEAGVTAGVAAWNAGGAGGWVNTGAGIGGGVITGCTAVIAATDVGACAWTSCRPVSSASANATAVGQRSSGFLVRALKSARTSGSGTSPGAGTGI